MQLKPIVAIIVLLLVVASLLVSGCTFPITTSPSPTASYPYQVPSQTPTATPPADLSSYFDTWFESGNAIMARPFTKSTNERGNDVYKGVARNATTPETNTWTIVIELTTSKAEAKQLYDQTVAQKLNEGYTTQHDLIARDKAESPYKTDFWRGVHYGSVQGFSVEYHYNSRVSSWLVITKSI